MAQSGRRYLFTGGGTGGHVSPNLAMIRGLRERDPSVEILYVGHARGFEKEGVPKHGIPIEFVDAAQFVGIRRPWAFIKMAIAIVFGTLKSIGIIFRFKPDLVVATGGYVSVPVVLAAALLRRRIFLHEQNALPGKANQFLARFAVRVGVSFTSALDYFPPPKGRVTGYPVSRSLGKESRADARARLGIADSAQVLLVFGGSMGARSINRALVGCLRTLLTDNPRLIVVHSTGKTRTNDYDAYEDTMRRVAEIGLPAELAVRYRVSRYLENLPDWYAASDLVVARSGAGAVMELGTMGRASILVPKMDVPGAHQQQNAEVLATKGGAEILDEQPSRENGVRISRVYPETLRKKIEELIRDEDALRRMERAALRTVIPNALDANLDELELLAENKPLLRLEEVQRETGFLVVGGISHEVVFRTVTVADAWSADVRIQGLGDVVFEIAQDQGNETTRFTILPRKGVVEVDGEPLVKPSELRPEQAIRANGLRIVFMKETRAFRVELEKTGIAKKAAWTALGTMLSRLAGFFREAATAATLGLSPITDVLTVGLRVSNFLRNVFAETAVETAFQPTFIQLLRSGRREEAWKLLGSTLRLILILTTLATIAAIATAPMWMPKIAPGFVGRDGLMEQAITLTRILFPFLIFISVAALLSSVLRTFNRFGVAANASILYTVGVCIGLAFYDRFGYVALGAGVLLGGALQMLFQLPWLFGREIRDGWGLRFSKSDVNMPAVRRVGRSTPNIVLDTVISRIGDVIDTILATPLATGTVSALYFGRILFNLPFAIVATSASTVLLKEFSEGIATKGREWERKTITSALNWMIVLLIPLSIGLIILGGPIVEWLFAWKRFTPEDVSRVSSALTAYSAGLLGWGIVNITGRIFAAYGRLGVPTAVNAACLLVNVALAIAMVNSSIGFTGIAWASTISFSLGAVARTWWLDRHLAKEGTRIDWRSIGSHFFKTTFATIMAAIAMSISLKLVANFNTLPEFFNRGIRVVVPGFFGLLAFAGAGFAIEIPLVMDIVARIFPKKPQGPTHDTKVDPVWLAPKPLLAWVEANRNSSILRTRRFDATVKDFLSESNWEHRNIGVKLVGLLKLGAFKQDLLRIAAERRPASRLHRFLGGDFIEPGFIRRNALVSLQQLGSIDTAFETTLLGALLDPYYEVRSTAAKLFAELGPRLSEKTREAAAPILRDLTVGPCHETACESIRALGSVESGPEAIVFLRRFATAANSKIRESLMLAYQALHARRLFPVGAEGVALIDEVLLTSQSFTPTFTLRLKISSLRNDVESSIGSAPASPKQSEVGA